MLRLNAFATQSFGSTIRVALLVGFLSHPLRAAMPLDVAKARARLNALSDQRAALVAKRLKIQTKERHGPIVEGRKYLAAPHGESRSPSSGMTRMEATKR